MTFWKRKPPVTQPILALAGFEVGQIVQHKIDGRRAVILELRWDDLRPIAGVAFSSKAGDEVDMWLAEIEPARAAATEPTP